MRVEYFFTLLKQADFILGNSSAGVTEAPVYGIKSINISHRQKNRHQSECIFNSEGSCEEIKLLITTSTPKEKFLPDYTFGSGDSADKFIASLKTKAIWELPTQKQFKEIE
jgi:UDP-N-acetylglucosamine 2-epimerase (hydrolysing)